VNENLAWESDRSMLPVLGCDGDDDDDDVQSFNLHLKAD